MSDLVSFFESVCTTNSFHFSYGNASNKNLLKNTEADKTYFLLDPLRRLKSFGEFGGEGESVYNGFFFLGVQSTIDKRYYNQSGDPDGNGKYREYILPLLNGSLKTVENALNCGDYEIRSWDITEAINQLDVNLDGLGVSFQIAIL